jgi:hypothetical protein
MHGMPEDVGNMEPGLRLQCSCAGFLFFSTVMTLDRARGDQAYPLFCSAGLMSDSRRLYKGGLFTHSLVFILLLLQTLQHGSTADEITVEVRRCMQNLDLRYYSDPLAAWPCSHQKKTLDTAKTAVIIVDMWDFHHCPSEHLIPFAACVAAAIRLRCLFMGLSVVFSITSIYAVH